MICDLFCVTLASEDEEFGTQNKTEVEIVRTSGVLPGPLNTMDNGAMDEIRPEYKEKKWGKTEDGQYIIDGFSFRGKRVFAKVVQGLRDFYKKGVEHDTDEYKDIIKVKALDAREKGNGLEIDVEITEKDKKRGIAVLKLYGPNSRKENVVMVTKNKQSDSKYVSMLALNFIKPWMKKKLDGSLVKKTVSVKGKRIPLFECPHCDVTSHSSPGLKGHITKKHAEFKKMKVDSVVQKKKRKLDESVKKNEISDVVDYLIGEVIDLSDEDELPGHIENVKEDEEVTLDECIDIKTETSYKSKCEFCSYEVITSRKYLAFQSMKSHKTSCSALKAKKLRKASKCEDPLACQGLMKMKYCNSV